MTMAFSNPPWIKELKEATVLVYTILQKESKIERERERERNEKKMSRQATNVAFVKRVKRERERERESLGVRSLRP